MYVKCAFVCSECKIHDGGYTADAKEISDVRFAEVFPTRCKNVNLAICLGLLPEDQDKYKNVTARLVDMDNQQGLPDLTNNFLVSGGERFQPNQGQWLFFEYPSIIFQRPGVHRFLIESSDFLTHTVEFNLIQVSK